MVNNGIKTGVWFSPSYARGRDPRCTAWRLVGRHGCQQLEAVPDDALVLSHVGDNILRPSNWAPNRMLVVLDTPYKEHPPMPLDRCFRLPPLISAMRDDGKLATAEALIGGVQVLGFSEQADAFARLFQAGPTFLESNFGPLLSQTLPRELLDVLHGVTRAVLNTFNSGDLSLMLMGSTLNEKLGSCHDIDLLWTTDEVENENFCIDDLLAYKRGDINACFVKCDDPRLRLLNTLLCKTLAQTARQCAVTWEFAGAPYWGTFPGQRHVHLHFFGPMTSPTYRLYSTHCAVFAEHQRRTGRILAGMPLRTLYSDTSLGVGDYASTLSCLERRMQQASMRLDERNAAQTTYQEDALVLVKSLVGIATLLAAWHGCFTDDKRAAIDFLVSRTNAFRIFRGIFQEAYELKVSHAAFCASDIKKLQVQWQDVVKAAWAEFREGSERQ